MKNQATENKVAWLENASYLNNTVYIFFFCAGAASVPQNDLYVEDLEAPCGQPVINKVSKIHVQNIPSQFRHISLHYYLEKVMENQVTCEVELFNADGVATFRPPVGMTLTFFTEILSVYVSLLQI